MTFRQFVLQDWLANRGNSKGRLVLILYRLAWLAASQHGFRKWVFLPYLVFYKLAVTWALGIALRLRSRFGAGGVVVGNPARLIHSHGS